MIFCGLDLSLTSTGIVIYDYQHSEVLIEEALKVKTKGLYRCSDIAQKILDILDQHKPDKIVLEGYFVNPKMINSSIKIIELGTVVRYLLLQYGHDVGVAAPMQLKKFVAGGGKSIKKDQIRLEVYKRWGYEHHSDDVVDAFGLTQMAVASKISKGFTQGQLAIVRDLGQI